jgi:hypothetical protein
MVPDTLLSAALPRFATFTRRNCKSSGLLVTVTRDWRTRPGVRLFSLLPRNGGACPRPPRNGDAVLLYYTSLSYSWPRRDRNDIFTRPPHARRRGQFFRDRRGQKRLRTFSVHNSLNTNRPFTAYPFHSRLYR